MTELVFILDRSGSMSGLEKDTIGGFNGMIEKQKGNLKDTLVTTVLFDTEFDIIHDRVSLADIPKLTEEEYYVGGCTALLDAVGTTIEHIEKIHKYARKEDVPEGTLFVITTDGMENASKKFTYEKIHELIEAKKKIGWEFIFLGANIDAEAEAKRMGISRKRATGFINDDEGIKLNAETVADVVQDYRVQMHISDDWDAPIRKNCQKRSGIEVKPNGKTYDSIMDLIKDLSNEDDSEDE